MNHHRTRKRNRKSQHTATTFDIMAGDKRVTLRQIPKPMFARSLAFVDTIDYPDGYLALFCGHNIGKPETIFGCFHCDCGGETWFAATSNLENADGHASSQSTPDGQVVVTAETVTA